MTDLVHEKYPDSHHDVYSKTIFGFWIYLLTDFILFATIFAAYAVLSGSTFGGPTSRELFNLPMMFVATLILSTSSFTAGLAGAAAHRKLKGWTVTMFIVTFVLGFAFMWVDLSDMARLVIQGYDWKKNAFLSGYFSLVGIHALHMVFALLWIIVLLVPVCIEGVSPVSLKRLTCLRMFWQFVNIVWIFIFTIVYLIGVI